MRTVIAAALILTAGTSHGALLGRAPLTPGGTDYQAYYDTTLNITWLANANASAGSPYDDGLSFTDGRMTWGAALEWTDSLNASNYLGVSEWRLPGVSPINGDTFTLAFSYNGSTDASYNTGAPGTVSAGSTASELAHLFYTTLNNKGLCDPGLSTHDYCSQPQAGWGLTNSGPFTNLQLFKYWSGTPVVGSSSSAWVFEFNGEGFQSAHGTGDHLVPWAVANGDPLVIVPIPSAAWLFGGALGLLGVARRRPAP